MRSRSLRTALGIGALSYLLGGFFVTWRLNRFPGRLRKSFTMSPWELLVPAETLRLRTRDGLDLGAWFFPPAEASAAIVVALHGYRGDRSEVLGISSYLWRRGYGVLVPDFRGRGANQPGRISMGAYETRDLAAALEWIRETRPAVPVGLVGYSMGGAVALMEGGRHPHVKAIVADCAYATQAGVLSYGVQRLIRLRGDFILPAAALFHRGYRRPGFGEVTPIDHAPEWRGKALFFIGAELDRTVSPEDTRRLFEAAPEPKVLWMGRGAPHCGVYFQDRGRYCRLVGQFLERYLGTASAVAGPQLRALPEDLMDQPALLLQAQERHLEHQVVGARQISDTAPPAAAPGLHDGLLDAPQLRDAAQRDPARRALLPDDQVVAFEPLRLELVDVLARVQGELPAVGLLGGPGRGPAQQEDEHERQESGHVTRSFEDVVIRVLFFGPARELAGTGERPLHLPAGATVGEAAERLAAFYPAMAALLQRCAFGVNEAYARRESALEAGDELAILPPIGGG